MRNHSSNAQRRTRQEDYDHFLYYFGLYKERLVPGHDSATLLRECLSEHVLKMLYRSHGAELTKFTEQQLSKNIIASCVTKQTDQARTTELHRSKQDPCQYVQSFLASFKSKSKQCNMRILFSQPSCEQVNDYSKKVVLSLFIGGIGDMEHQQNLLAEQDITLSKAVTMAVARETAKRSQEILDSSQQVAAGISTYKKGLNKIVVPPDCCNFCGQKKHSDKKDCPAKYFNCSCGIKGHYRKLCFRNGKPRNPQRSGGKNDHKKEDKEAKPETEHSIHESCFSINSEERTYPWVQEESSPQTHKMLTPLPVVNQQEEVVLASLQYSPGNDK